MCNPKCLGVPIPTEPFLLVTDSCNYGYGGSLYQFLPTGDVQKLQLNERSGHEIFGVDKATGKLQHWYPDDFHLVPIGHWNWKYSEAPSKYST